MKIKLTQNKLRVFIFLLTALIHILMLFFIVINYEKAPQTPEQPAILINLVDVQVEAPPPRIIEPEEIFTNTEEAIAETMIETDEEPPDFRPENIGQEAIEFIPMEAGMDIPVFPEDQIVRAVIYPPIAQRSNIEGMVYLELFVDRQGNIRNITVLREEPADRGFAEAAINAFNGIKADTPAMLNGESVAVRFRRRMVFKLK